MQDGLNLPDETKTMNRILFLILFVTIGLSGFAQSMPAKATAVKYDPLFWKDDLNLKVEQRNRINEINIKFYQDIQQELQTATAQRDQSSLKVKIDKSLEERSQEIWNTLYPKQRKKWEKLMRSYGDYQI
jgi:S-adenosylmethionine:tRNA-ribosyltransferase-isomerase (queuine synthetase)